MHGVQDTTHKHTVNEMKRTKLMLQEKIVRRFKKKCGELVEKLPIATTAPIKSFRRDDSSPRSIVRSRVSKNTSPLPAMAWKMDL
jgi:hypothetical protein